MKQIAFLLVALCLVTGILFISVADVNHGHGPGVHEQSVQATHADDEHIPVQSDHDLEENSTLHET